MKIRFIFIQVFAIIMFSHASYGTIIIIPEHYPSIQQGINAAKNGDTVLIHPGTYIENLTVIDKSIIIGSLTLLTQDTNYISQTVIDGNQSGHVIRYENSNTPSLLCGLTITNGRSTMGGGIFITNSLITLDYLRIVDNITICGSYLSVGGGIYCENSVIALNHFELRNNTAFCLTPPINPEGGGINAQNSILTINNGLISNNQAFLGGGLFLSDCELSMLAVTLDENSTPNPPGNAIAAFDTDMNIQQSIFSHHSGGLGTIYVDITQQPDYQLIFTNCLFYANDNPLLLYGKGFLQVNNCTFADNQGTHAISSSMNGKNYIMNSIFRNDFAEEIYLSYYASLSYIGYSTITGGPAGIGGSGYIYQTGQIYDLSPDFISDSSYHLSEYSPCIGVGIDTLEVYPFLAAPLFDLEYSQRPNPAGSMPDLGAYEHPFANPLTGIDQEMTNNGANYPRIYPNPASGLFYIENCQDRPIISVMFMDMVGRELYCLPDIHIKRHEILTFNARELDYIGLILVVLNTADKRFFSKLIINAL